MGKIGLDRDVSFVFSLIAGGMLLISLATLADGAAMMVAGHLSGLLPVLAPLALSASVWGIVAAGLRSLDRRIPCLIQEISQILGSTAIYTDPAAPDGGRGEELGARIAAFIPGALLKRKRNRVP